MKTINVNYGTIKGMKVELAQFPCDIITFHKAWIKGFIEYMTRGSIVSNDVLISSIGQSNAKKALVEGLKERNAPDFMIGYCEDQENWTFEVLYQREGREAAFFGTYGEKGRVMLEALKGLENE